MKGNVNVIIPKDGAILSVPDDTPTEALKELSGQLHAIWPDRRFLMVAGDIAPEKEPRRATHIHRQRQAVRHWR